MVSRGVGLLIENKAVLKPLNGIRQYGQFAQFLVDEERKVLFLLHVKIDQNDLVVAVNGQVAAFFSVIQADQVLAAVAGVQGPGLLRHENDVRKIIVQGSFFNNVDY